MLDKYRMPNNSVYRFQKIIFTWKLWLIAESNSRFNNQEKK